MIRFARHSAFPMGLAALLCLLQPATLDAQAPAGVAAQKMPIWEARRIVAAENMQHLAMRFTDVSLEIDRPKGKRGTETLTVDLTTAPEVRAECNSHSCRLKASPDFSYKSPLALVAYGAWADPGQEITRSSTCSAGCSTLAQDYARAFNRLREYAANPGEPMRAFEPRAAAWRALAAKPAIPEEVRVQQLLAEDAVKENKPGKALRYFETGIEMCPTWPEGHFNAALIAGQVGDYLVAVEHMQAYLLLLPDAPDAAAARDKVLVWKVKAGEKR